MQKISFDRMTAYFLDGPQRRSQSIIAKMTLFQEKPYLAKEGGSGSDRPLFLMQNTMLYKPV